MKQPYLSADEVVAILDISKATLYSYVSRGFIRSEETGDKTRARRYVASDVEALRQRKEQRRNPAQSAAAALHFGDPVLESAITFIAENELYYRGQNALTLAAQLRFEDVVVLLWTGTTAGVDALMAGAAPLAPLAPALQAAIHALVQQGHVADALPMALLATAPTDLGAYNQASDAVARTGLRILHRFIDVLTIGEKSIGGKSTVPPADGVVQEEQLYAQQEEREVVAQEVVGQKMVAQRLQERWVSNQPQLAAPLNGALILCADHELNASSFTARCVASTGATPYAAVVAALAALQGYKHGGATCAVASFLREAEDDPKRATEERLRFGGSLPGFGHPLYPAGDPRGRMLLTLAAEHALNPHVVTQADEICAVARQAMQLEPNLDFGLTVMAQGFGLPSYAPFALFALGRTAGWIGHCIEQYAEDRLIRPRARYTGIEPQAGTGL
ncbi:MAG: citrate synthase family protein [Caldilineaceae bacterium]|nr:citrate synthase family protein [Caldilineaceae bacterium]